MKIKIIGLLKEDSDKTFSFPLVFDKKTKMRVYYAKFDTPDGSPYYPDHSNPLPVMTKPNQTDGIWCFRRYAVEVSESVGEARDEILVKIKHIVLRKEKELKRIAKEVEAFENLAKIPSAVRERIPESVRLFVWQRDQGQCVKCGSRELLEFDHIIPVALGGSNTERNIQLLCERCNREKSKNV